CARGIYYDGYFDYW
nr:immunoglobulin heavy chain junction region [Mus musculus]NSM07843.1 immunoglobulin heavy chain junction region [Mus musculus]NSM08833.1 immunoglobulin heavy chain junction region [Mus musculus]